MLDLQDRVQELVVQALEAGEECVLISEGVQELVPVVSFMGYHYDVEEDLLIVRW